MGKRVKNAMSQLHPKIARIVRSRSNVSAILAHSKGVSTGDAPPHVLNATDETSKWMALCNALNIPSKKLVQISTKFSSTYHVNEIVPRYWSAPIAQRPIPKKFIYFDEDISDQFLFPLSSQFDGAWGPIYRGAFSPHT